MYVCGCGGNGMMCHINYSTEPNFANQHTIFAPTSMPANTMLPVEATPVITLKEGDTLQVRVYPWYNSSKEITGKTICLSDVFIRGKVFENDTDGISSVEKTDVRPLAYYTIDGTRINGMQHGLNIIRYTDGSVKKIMR